MMKTCLAMGKEGLTFAAVHDCFMTHACDVERMSQILREQFVSMYSEPVLAKVAKGFENLIDEHRGQCSREDLEAMRNHIRNYPKPGKLDLKQILDSKYFFC